MFRQEDVNKHIEKIKTALAKFKYNYNHFMETYQEFCEAYEKETPEEKEKHKKDKTLADAGFKFLKEISEV
jgi:K+/H+ antiporter YhaU regulatory subunit KhtT